MNLTSQSRIVNAKALKRMRRSVRQKCQQIGIPLDTIYSERQHSPKMVRVPFSALNQTGYKTVTPVQRILGNCFRNETKSMKAIGGQLFTATAGASR